MSEFLGLMPGGDQSSPGRVRRPVGLKRPLSPNVSFQHLPSALASFSGFLVSLSISRSARGGSSANGLHPDGIAPPGIPLLGCSPPTTMRYKTVFGGGHCSGFLHILSPTYWLLPCTPSVSSCSC